MLLCITARSVHTSSQMPHTNYAMITYAALRTEVGESTHLSVTVDTEPDLSNQYKTAAPVGVQFAVRNGTSANFPNSNTSTNPASTISATSATANPTTTGTSSSYYATNNVQSVFNSTRRAGASSPVYSDTSESTRPESPQPVEEEGEGRGELLCVVRECVCYVCDCSFSA